MATVWDEEIVSIRLALDLVAIAPVLVLSDSQVAIASVRNAAACGSARIPDLRAVFDMVEEWVSAKVSIWFVWVKVHVGLAGNEFVDEMEKLGCAWEDAPLVTKGGVRAL